MSSTELRHPEEEQLLLYADGELPARDAARIRSHLEACWQCRTELAEIHKVIGECVRYRQDVLAPNLTPPPAPWTDIYRRFAEIDAALARPSWFRRLGQALSLRPARWLPAAAALVLAAVVFLQFHRPPSVQAAELLQKAVLAEDSRLLLPRRIQIRTKTQRLTRVVGAIARPVAAPQSEERALRELFVAARYDWEDPLSARSYQNWRNQLSEKQDEVTTERESYRIRTTTESGELAAATLTLRAPDLRPVEGTLQFRNQEWVEITDLGEAPPAPIAAVEAPRAQPAPAAPQPQAAPAATLGDELQVLAALHRIGADLGDPVEVTRSGGQVLVSGVGISPQRQQEIREALAPLPKASVQFTDPAAAAVEAEPAQREPASISVLSRLQASLEERQLSSRLLDTSEAVMSRVYALRRLAEKFPPPVEAGLSTADKQVLRTLRQEHASVVTREAAALERILNPLLSLPDETVAGLPRSVILSDSWQPATEELFRAARRVEALLAAVLGGAPAEASEAELPTRLLSALAELRGCAEAYERLSR